MEQTEGQGASEEIMEPTFDAYCTGGCGKVLGQCDAPDRLIGYCEDCVAEGKDKLPTSDPMQDPVFIDKLQSVIDSGVMQAAVDQAQQGIPIKEHCDSTDQHTEGS